MHSAWVAYVSLLPRSICPSRSRDTRGKMFTRSLRNKIIRHVCCAPDKEENTQKLDTYESAIHSQCKLHWQYFRLCVNCITDQRNRSDKIDPGPFPVVKEMWSRKTDFLSQVQRLDTDVVSFNRGVRNLLSIFMTCCFYN